MTILGGVFVGGVAGFGREQLRSVAGLRTHTLVAIQRNGALFNLQK